MVFLLINFELLNCQRHAFNEKENTNRVMKKSTNPFNGDLHLIEDNSNKRMFHFLLKNFYEYKLNSIF